MKTFYEILGYITSVSIISGLVLYLIRALIKDKINNYFGKKMENHKHNLQLITEQAKFDYQRKIQDFGLYTTKRHEAYAEVYKLVLIAYGKVTDLRGLRRVLSFEDYDSEDIKKYLEEKKIPTRKITEIVGKWDVDREIAVKEIRGYEKLRFFQEARNDYAEARNYLYLNELYMADEIVKDVGNVLERLGKLLINYEYPDAGTRTENQSLIKEIDGGLVTVKDSMRKELSISYYGSEN